MKTTEVGAGVSPTRPTKSGRSTSSFWFNSDPVVGSGKASVPVWSMSCCRVFSHLQVDSSGSSGMLQAWVRQAEAEWIDQMAWGLRERLGTASLGDLGESMSDEKEGGVHHFW